MSCNVRINAKGETEVVADNGQKSILFEEARKITNTEAEALDVWAVGQTPMFKDSFVFPKIAAYVNKISKALDRVSNKVVESPTKSLVKEYTDRIAAIKKADPKNYWSVDMPSKSEIESAAKEGRIVATEGGMAIVTADGSLIGLFKDDDTQKGVAKTLQEARVDIGGIKLDNFDGYLTKLYEKNGFRVVSRLKFNEEVAPKDWNKKINGTPDVVFMVYDKNGDLDITEKVFEKDQYEEALAYRESFIEQAKEVHPFYNQKSIVKEIAPTITYNNRKTWDESRGPQVLEGAPIIKGRINVTGADPELTFWAEEYARRNDIDYKRQSKYVEIDEDRAKRIAQAYEDMEHNPQDPAVKEAFSNLIQQTTAQYNLLQEAGYKFYFFDETNDPYNGNPWSAMEDLRTNKQMAVFTTEAGFGSGATELDVEDNPMLADTGLEWSFGGLDGPKRRVLANDLFRAVHDAFGHGLEGSGFRDRGEENAWQSHARLFTGSAIAAITSETRGQNSWLNYGKYGEQNRTAKIEDTVFADQKTGLMPEWTWTEGFDTGASKGLIGGANFANFFADVTNTKNGGANFNNVSEILQKPVEGYEEELKAYLKYGGNFQKHIMASIPGFVDSRIRILKAMADVSVILGKGAKPVNMLDITSSEGYFTKAYAQLAQNKGVNAKADALDAGVTFQRDFQNTPQVRGVNFLLEAWGESFEDPGTGKAIPLFKPTKKYGVIFEGMGFQFFTPTREKEIREVKDMMEDNGLFISMQKLKNPDYAKREVLKDEYKSQFFSQEILKEKAATVLAKSDENAVGMMDYQYDRVEYESVLARNFKYVVQIYSSGNFAGYYATDNKQIMEKALESTGDTTTKFNEEVTPKVISGEISTVKVDKSKIQVRTTLINGIKGYTAYDENGVKIGALRTKAYQQGEVITGVTINEEFRGQGIGKGLYVHVIKGLMKQGKVLYSDKSRAAGAEVIWQQLEDKGVAQRNSDGTYQTKPSPSVIDKNGEARAGDVKNFIDKQNVNEPLSAKEVQDLSLSLATTKFSTSGELLKALNKAFMPNSHFAPTKNSLTLSGIYSKVEVNNIMNSPDLQSSIKEFIYKLENTEEEVQSEDIGDERFIVAEEGMPVNSFGKFKVANPFITEENAINQLGGVKTEAELENAINNSELDYLKGQKGLLPLFSKFEKVSQKTFVEGVLSDRPLNDTEGLLNVVLETGEQPLLSKAVKAIFEVSDEVYQDYPAEAKTLLKAVDRLAANIGLDLKGLDNVYEKKSPEQMKDFLVGMISLIEKDEIKLFSELYNKFFEVEVTPKKVVQQVAEKDKGKALISILTEAKAYSLFEAEGLISIGDNLYQKTNAKDLTLEEVLEIIFERSKIDSSLFPENIKSLIEIKRYIQEQARGIDLFKVDNVDPEVLQKMAAYVIVNKGELNNDKTFPSIESELSLMNDTKSKAGVNFVKDFYKEQLKQSRTNSQEYQDFYSKFEVTGEGINLVSNDPITVKQIESQIEDYPELASYFNFKIGSDLTFPDNTELEQDYDDSNIRNYYANHPQALPVYKGITQKVNDRTMEIKSTEAFLRLPSGVYEFNSSKGETSLYSELILNDTNKKDYELNVAPIRLDNRGVNNNQEVEKKNKNLYNKSEGGQIDDNLSCN